LSKRNGPKQGDGAVIIGIIIGELNTVCMASSSNAQPFSGSGVTQ